MEEEKFLRKIKAIRILMCIMNKNKNIEIDMCDICSIFYKMPQNIFDETFNFNEYTEIKQSSTHGEGVFAKQNIKKGSVITIYPCDTLINTKTEMAITRKGCEEKSKIYEKKYKFNCGDFSIIGFPENKTFSGHLINDACPCVSEITNDLIKDINSLKFVKTSIKYMIKSLDRLNCELKYNKWVAYIVTTRDILSGEELLMTYGASYWSEGKMTLCLAQRYWYEYFNLNKNVTHNQKVYTANLLKKFT